MPLATEPANGKTPIARIGLIVTFAIIMHAALLWLLADGLGLRASYATLIAFLAAVVVGYRVYDHFDLRSERFRGEASPGLVLTACAGAVLNALVFTMLAFACSSGPRSFSQRQRPTRSSFTIKPPITMTGNSSPSGAPRRQVHSNPHACLSSMAATGSRAAMW